MSDLRSVFAAGIVACFLASANGQDPTHEIGPDDIEALVDGADAIVVGTFRVGWAYPWFDGWHYTSEMQLSEQVIAAVKGARLYIPWIRTYGVSCFMCSDLRPFDGKAGIWFLRKRDNEWRVFGGPSLCGGPLDSRYLDDVRVAAQRKMSTAR